MMTFKEFIGYDLHTSRIAFDNEGGEVVFVHDFFLMKRRIYVAGEQVFNRHSQWLGFSTDAEFDCQNISYRIISRTANVFTMEQDVTLLVEGRVIGRKTHSLYGALSLKKKLHAILGAGGFGAIVGLVSATIFGG